MGVTIKKLNEKVKVINWDAYAISVLGIWKLRTILFDNLMIDFGSG